MAKCLFPDTVTVRARLFHALSIAIPSDDSRKVVPHVKDPHEPSGERSHSFETELDRILSEWGKGELDLVQLRSLIKSGFAIRNTAAPESFPHFTAVERELIAAVNQLIGEQIVE